jgi:hypothetical protein
VNWRKVCKRILVIWLQLSLVVVVVGGDLLLCHHSKSSYVRNERDDTRVRAEEICGRSETNMQHGHLGNNYNAGCIRRFRWGPEKERWVRENDRCGGRSLNIIFWSTPDIQRCVRESDKSRKARLRSHCAYPWSCVRTEHSAHRNVTQSTRDPSRTRELLTLPWYWYRCNWTLQRMEWLKHISVGVNLCQLSVFRLLDCAPLVA